MVVFFLLGDCFLVARFHQHLSEDVDEEVKGVLVHLINVNKLHKHEEHAGHSQRHMQAVFSELLDVPHGLQTLVDQNCDLLHSRLTLLK